MIITSMIFLMVYMRFLVGLLALTCLICSEASAIRSNTFTYITAPQDVATDIVMLGGYRAYAPQSGRFLKQDSDSPFLSRKTENGFDYGSGNPILNTDPNGHLSQGGRNLMYVLFVGIFIGVAVSSLAVQIYRFLRPSPILIATESQLARLRQNVYPITMRIVSRDGPVFGQFFH